MSVSPLLIVSKLVICQSVILSFIQSVRKKYSSGFYRLLKYHCIIYLLSSNTVDTTKLIYRRVVCVFYHLYTLLYFLFFFVPISHHDRRALGIQTHEVYQVYNGQSSDRQCYSNIQISKLIASVKWCVYIEA